MRRPVVGERCELWGRVWTVVEVCTTQDGHLARLMPLPDTVQDEQIIALLRHTPLMTPDQDHP